MSYDEAKWKDGRRSVMIDEERGRGVGEANVRLNAATLSSVNHSQSSEKRGDLGGSQ